MTLCIVDMFVQQCIKKSELLYHITRQ